MIKIRLLFLFIFPAVSGFPQGNPFHLVEYFPAPGQHINIESVGTPHAALQMTQNQDKLVSLGSFGGYIILRFEEACVNDPENPYGVDFTIFGNAFSGSAEPGVIWVMKDENHNGLPDETWYEIAGSNYFHPATQQKYQVTYFPADERDVLWQGSDGRTGKIEANSFNLQEYYPETGYFPDYPQDSVTFEGTLLFPAVDSSERQNIRISPFAFGYADNHPRKKGVASEQPDNPYTTEVEGAGGSPIDISWAVDQEGNYVNPDTIHFIKIVSGSLTNAGRLGEISTDVSWVADVQPDSVQNSKENLLVVYNYPEKILAGDSVLLEAAWFEKGRKTEAEIIFKSENESVATVNNKGVLKAVEAGEAEIVISANDEIEQITIKSVIPDSIQITTDFSSVYPGDTIKMNAAVFDNENDPLQITVDFASSDPAVGEVFQDKGSSWFRAVQPGETKLICTINGFQVQEIIPVKVLSENDKIDIYFTLKNENENLFPLQWIEVERADLNHTVAGRQQNYSGLNRFTLFHALAAGLNEAGVSFGFKDDAAANGNLYLYSVEKEGVFTYGWGGKTVPEDYARGWIACLNSIHFLNSFDEIEISDGDTVDLYHISNINNPWKYSRLLSEKDSAGIGEQHEMRVEETTCTYSDFEITAGGFLPVAGQLVSNGKKYYTGENGTVRFVPETEPPVVFYSENNAVLVAKMLSTGFANKKLSRALVFPNPAKKELFIKHTGGFTDCSVQLSDQSGRILVREKRCPDVCKLNIASLSPGIYYLVIAGKDNSETHKIVKR